MNDPSHNIAIALSTLQRGRRANRLGLLNETEQTSVRKQLERLVEVHHLGVAHLAVWEHNRDIKLFANRLRECRSWRDADNVMKQASHDFPLVYGLDRIDLRSQTPTPRDAANQLHALLSIKNAAHHRKRSAQCEVSAYYMKDAVWIRSDHELSLVAGAADIFMQWVGKLPTLTADKPGIAFLKAVVAATGHRRISVERRLAYILSLIARDGVYARRIAR